jgi:hypothetical protein
MPKIDRFDSPWSKSANARCNQQSTCAGLLSPIGVNLPMAVDLVDRLDHLSQRRDRRQGLDLIPESLNELSARALPDAGNVVKHFVCIQLLNLPANVRQDIDHAARKIEEPELKRRKQGGWACPHHQHVGRRWQ